MNKLQLISIDTETTGLRWEKDSVVTEIALVVPNEDFTRMQPYYWLIELTEEELACADTYAMKLNGYHAKIAEAKSVGEGYVQPYQRSDVAQAIFEITEGAIIAGMNCAFDAGFTRKFMEEQEFTPKWNYHLFEIESACIGYLGKAAPFPWKSASLADAMGIKTLPANRTHGAKEDAIWNCFFLKILREHTTPHLRFLKGKKNDN